MAIKSKAKNFADFRNSHHMETVQRNKLRTAIAKLRATGPEAWEYEREFFLSNGIGLCNTEWLRQEKEFEPHVVEAPSVGGISRNNRIRYVWVADPKVAARMRTTE